MNLYFDTEFTGLHKATTLISIGIISDDGKTFYAEFTDYCQKVDDWIKTNVIENLTLPKINEKEDVMGQYLEWESQGYTIKNPNNPTFYNHTLMFERQRYDDTHVVGNKEMVAESLGRWLSQFDSIQFVSDVCHYDFVLLIDLFGSAWDLPKNVSPVCHDINADIARYYGITESEAFDLNREETLDNLSNHNSYNTDKKHNALHDAEVIRGISIALQYAK